MLVKLNHRSLCFSLATLISITMSLSVAAQTSTSLAEAAMERDMAGVENILNQSEVDINELGPFETPALHWTVRFDELKATRLLLEAGANPNLTSRYGLSALSLAIANANDEMVSLLLSFGANPNMAEISGESMLMSASAKGVKGIVMQLLAAGAAVDVHDPNFGQTALMFAARAGHKEIVSLLLEEGADPNSATTIGETPKWIGANSVPGFGFGVGIIRGGVPADRGRREPTPGGMTPLLYAARHDHTDVAELLLNAGAKLEKSEANGISPLLMAISNHQVEVAYFLIANGADINVSDWYGRTPLWEAINVRNLYVHNGTFKQDVERAPLLALIQTLLEKGADVNAQTAETPPVRHHLLPITGTLEWVDFTGQTPFISAALAGDIKVMKLLLEHGADPHLQTYEGTNALMAAAGVNWVVAQTYTESADNLLAAVTLCWELGMDVNHVNSMGLAAVHGAANRGSDDIIRFLVEKGAHLDSMLDNEGRSPLDWAKGVFLATHPAEPKPSSITLISELMKADAK